MLAGGVVPEEERLAVLGAAVEKVQRIGENLVVEGFHALGGQRTLVFRRPVRRAGDHAARIEFLAELRIGRPIRVFQVLVGVEVIEVAEKLVEAVPVRQMLFEIAKVILAELRRGVALGLQDFGERDVLLLQAGRRARRADRRQAGADRQLSGDEGRAAGGATRLGVESASRRSPSLPMRSMFGVATPMTSPP